MEDGRVSKFFQLRSFSKLYKEIKVVAKIRLFMNSFKEYK